MLGQSLDISKRRKYEKIFLRRIPLSKFLAKTLRKFAMCFKTVFSIVSIISSLFQSNAPLVIIWLCKPFFQSSNHFWNTFFLVSSNSACFGFSSNSSIVAKCFPFFGIFSFGKRKKLAGAKSCLIIWLILFSAKNSHTSSDVWAVTLSWCKIHVWFFHNSVRF